MKNSELPWHLNTGQLPGDIDRANFEVMKSGNPISVEEAGFLSDGTELTFLSRKVPLKNTEGEITGLAGISIDITDKKLLEHEREEAFAKLQVANEVKDEFIANMSHDLRTPMTGIMGMIEEFGYIAEDIRTALQDNPELAVQKIDEATTEMIKYVGIAKGSTDELLNLFNEVIHSIRLESGNIDNIIEPFDLKAVIKKDMQLLAPTAEQKKLTMRAVIDPNIPRSLVGNRRSLDRILVNLIGNALKFTEQGVVTISASLLHLTENSANIQINVEDTGIGIPADKYDEIFEHFSRLTSSYQGVYGGYGMGLFAVKKHIDSLGGKITVDSTVGKGSVFGIELTFDLAQ